MPKRFLIVILFWPLVCASVSAQESGVLGDPIGSYNRANSDAADAEAAASFRLRGVLISQSGRSALVNDRLSREGDRVAGAEILAIEEGRVRILMGSRELTVYVGSTAVGGRSSSQITRMSRKPARLRSIPELNSTVVSVPTQASTQARPDTHAHHGPVKQGETLSGIAQRYISEGVTTNQVMIALFQANQQAFGGNINVLYEGAILRIPNGDELRRQPLETATAEVVRQADAWRTGYQQRSRLARLEGQRQYGPVSNGETLSAIAERVLRDGATMNQMMIALFQANPDAFGGNINVLHEGAILRIPDGDELRRQPPETATAEVMRQMDAWRSGYRQQARSTAAHTHMTASSVSQSIRLSNYLDVPQISLTPR